MTMADGLRVQRIFLGLGAGAAVLMAMFAVAWFCPTRLTGSLDQLAVLTIQAEDLGGFPSCLLSLASLTALSLNIGPMTLPPQLVQLRALTQLTVHRCGMTDVPPVIGELAGLIELALPYNDLLTLPDFLVQLTHLRRLDLRMNNLREMPAVLSRMPWLEELDLSDNPLPKKVRKRFDQLLPGCRVKFT